MRILVLGDSHGDINFLVRALELARESGCEKLFQVGDFGFWPRKPTGQDFIKGLSLEAARCGVTVYWLDGNHEDHDVLDDKVAVAADVPGAIDEDGFVRIASDVWYSPRGHRWVWDGVRFLSLGGAFSIDRKRRTKGISYFDQEVVSWDDVSRCGSDPVDVMLSHDAPLGVPTVEMHVSGNGFGHFPESTENRRKVREVVDKVDPKVVIHGHYHYRYTDYENGRKIVGLAHNADGLGAAAAILETEGLRGSDSNAV